MPRRPKPLRLEIIVTVQADDQATLDKLETLIQELPAKFASASQAQIDAAVKPVQAALDAANQDKTDTTAAFQAKAAELSSAVDGVATAP